MKFIKDYLEKRKRKKIQNQIADLLEKAYQFQRNGKLREYAELIKQVEELELYFDSANQTQTLNPRLTTGTIPALLIMMVWEIKVAFHQERKSNGQTASR